MIFAAHWDADASSSRSSRLMFAGVIACSSLAITLALALTLERMTVLRVAGPRTTFEIAALAMVDPPKPIPPPDKPETTAAALATDDEATGLGMSEADPEPSIVEPGRSDAPRTSGLERGGGIPGPASTGSPCVGPMCAKGPIGLPGGLGTCVGAHCKPAASKPAPPPEPLELDALACLVCPDPEDAALRSTAAGQAKRSGTNVTRFCVDERGRVEPGSVETEDGHGDPTIDRLCREAVKGWRFSPAKIEGQARRACSAATFRIRFE